MNTLRLWWVFIRLYIKTQLQYKASFVSDIVVSLTTPLITYINVWIYTANFKTVSGWSLPQLVVLYSIMIISYGFANMFVGNGALSLEEMIRGGKLDINLIRPYNTVGWIMMQNFSHISVSNVIAGVVGLGITCYWRPLWQWGIILLSVICGVVIIGSIMWIVGTFSFWMFGTQNLYDLVAIDIRMLAHMPLTIFPRWLYLILTLVLPYAFVAFIPLSIFPDIPKAGIAPGLALFGPPAIAVLLVFISSCFWRAGLKRYAGAGG